MSGVDGKDPGGIGPGGVGSGGEILHGVVPPNIPYARELAVALEAVEAGARVLRHYFRSGNLDIRQKQANDFVTRADEESEKAILRVIRGAFPDHGVLAEESGRSIRPRSPGSEGPGEEGASYEWIIDPLDGTSNFLQGLPVFCISIACRRITATSGRIVVGVVLDPLGGNLFSATHGGGARWNGEPMKVSDRPGLEGAFLSTGYPFRAKKALDLYLDLFRALFFRARGIRRCGAAALDLAYTAAGVYDGFFEFRLSPWDVAAGCLLLTEAGGVLTDLDGGSDFFGLDFAEGKGFAGNVLAAPPKIHRELLATVAELTNEADLAALSPL